MPRHFWQDESGKNSVSRVGLCVCLLFEAYTIIRYGNDISNAILSFYATLDLAFISWAGGKGVAESISRWGGRAVEGIGAAIRDRVLPSHLDNEMNDDA